MTALKWWEFSKRRHCPHLRIRGIYGDAVNHTPGHRRLQCVACLVFLDGPVSIANVRVSFRDDVPK